MTLIHEIQFTGRRLCVASFVLVCFACGIAQLPGDILFPNSKCLPAAMPVTTCGCPATGPDHPDRCEGTLPKVGTMYGNVDCFSESNSNCTKTTQLANSCGRIAMCPCVTCSEGLYEIPCGCTIFTIEQKPPCTTKWGNCVWVAPAP